MIVLFEMSRSVMNVISDLFGVSTRHIPEQTVFINQAYHSFLKKKKNLVYILTLSFTDIIFYVSV